MNADSIDGGKLYRKVEKDWPHHDEEWKVYIETAGNLICWWCNLSNLLAATSALGPRRETRRSQYVVGVILENPAGMDILAIFDVSSHCPLEYFADLVEHRPLPSIELQVVQRMLLVWPEECALTVCHQTMVEPTLNLEYSFRWSIYDRFFSFNHWTLSWEATVFSQHLYRPWVRQTWIEYCVDTKLLLQIWKARQKEREDDAGDEGLQRGSEKRVTCWKTQSKITPLINAFSWSVDWQSNIYCLLIWVGAGSLEPIVHILTSDSLVPCLDILANIQININDHPYVF